MMHDVFIFSYIASDKTDIAIKLSLYISYKCLQLLHLCLFYIIKKGEIVKSNDIYVLKTNQDSNLFLLDANKYK